MMQYEKKEQLSVRIPARVVERLEEGAAIQELTKAEYVVRALDQYYALYVREGGESDA